MRLGANAKCLMLLWLMLAEAANAQQDTKPKELPDAPVAKGNGRQQKRGNSLETTIELLGRRSVFFPDLATNKNALKPKQKFELFADESIAPSRFLSSAFGAGVGQARDTLSGYGQEIGGYGKRFGSSMATTASDSFFTKFVLSSALRRDPRYFVILHGGMGHRIGYALSRTVITRTDAGTQTANWPGLIGPLLAESLAITYLPAKEQTTGKTFARYGWRIGTTTASNVLKEYWPTIFRSLRLAKSVPEFN